METFERVAGRYFAYRYARLLLAMSMGEAKQILGFPPSANPTAEEVSKAYKAKAFANHPDRGGDPAKMVEINVAKDVLLGGGSSSRPGRPQPQRDPPPPPPPPPPPMEGKSFSQVMSSMPGGVVWKFRSGVAFSDSLKDNPEGGRYWRVSYGWVLYGQTESHHIFAGIRVAKNQQNTDVNWKDLVNSGGWEGFHTSAPRRVNLIKVAPKMVSGILGSLPDMNSKLVPKKFSVLSGGTVTLADLTKRADLSLKDAILGSGSMDASESKGLRGRKKMVTIEPIFNREKWNKMKESGPIRGDTAAYAYNWIVEVNGKGRSLGDDEIDQLLKNHFMSAVYNYDYDKGKKNLTRLRGGFMSAGSADAIRLLFEALHLGPLKDEIEEVLEQLKGVKKAAMQLPLEHVAMLFGEPLHVIYELAND